MERWLTPRGPLARSLEVGQPASPHGRPPSSARVWGGHRRRTPSAAARPSVRLAETADSHSPLISVPPNRAPAGRRAGGRRRARSGGSLRQVHAELAALHRRTLGVCSSAPRSAPPAWAAGTLAAAHESSASVYYGPLVVRPCGRDTERLLPPDLMSFPCLTCGTDRRGRHAHGQIFSACDAPVTRAAQPRVRRGVP